MFYVVASIDHVNCPVLLGVETSLETVMKMLRSHGYAKGSFKSEFFKIILQSYLDQYQSYLEQSWNKIEVSYKMNKGSHNTIVCIVW